MKKTKKPKRKKQKPCSQGCGGLSIKTPLVLLSLLTISTVLAGCQSKPVVLHPIQQTDIEILKAGDNFNAPKDGAFLSNFYIEEVMKAKIEK